MKITKIALLAIMISLLFSCKGTKNKKKSTSECACSKECVQEPTAMSDHWDLIGEAVNQPGYDIWGSSPIRDEKGNVHIFCARWSSEIPFKKAWRYDSEIAHYVSESPVGPFKFVEVVGKGTGTGTWNSAGYHNPNIKKIDGKYVLVFIANDGGEKHGPNQRIGMLISEDLNGPWSAVPNEDTPLLSPPTDSTIWCYNSKLGVNNPTIIKHPNGKYLMYFKAMLQVGGKGKRSMGLAISEKLEGPYIIQPEPITANEAGIEDGYTFYWRGHICLLTTDNHGILEKGGGLLWISKDGMHFNPEPFSGFHNCQDFYLGGKMPEGANARYGNKVKFERPQLLMDENNEPEYLYCPSGIALDGSDGTNSYVMNFEENLKL